MIHPLSVPSTLDDWLSEAQRRFSLNEFAAAQAAFEQVLASRPDFPEVLNNLGCVLEAQNQFPAVQARFGRP